MATVTLTGTPPVGEVGQAYSFTPVVGNSAGTNQFTLAGTLPAGLSFSTTTGTVSGTPTTTGTTSGLSIAITDDDGTATLGFTLIVVGHLTLSYPNTLIVSGDTLSVSPNVTGGTGTLSYVATGMPAGLSINPGTGVISGTTGVVSIDTITVMVTDSDTVQATGIFALSIISPLQLTGVPEVGEVGVPMTFVPTVQGATTTHPLTFSIANGTLPAGLSLNTATGVISGTPTAIGSSVVSLAVTDGIQTLVESVTTFNVVSALTASVTPVGFYVRGRPVSLPVTTTGGSGPVVVTLGTGAPPGLSVSTTAQVITGTATTSGTYETSITVSDNVTSIALTVAIVIIDPLVVTYPSSTLEDGYALDLVPAPTGGHGTVTYALASGSTLPTGLSLNTSTGVVTGQVVHADDGLVFGITASDDTGPSPVLVTLSVMAKLSLSGIPANGATGRNYNFQVLVTGGVGPYTFSVSPTPGHNLSLNTSTGLITSTSLSTSGSVTTTVTVVDSLGAQATLPVSFSIYDLLVVSGTPPQAEVGVLYLFTPTISAGSGTKTFSITSGTLPAGLSLNSNTGAVSGTPTTPGPYTFTLTGHDLSGDVGLPVVITVASPLAISGTLPNGVVGQVYSFTPVVVGGETPKTFSSTGVIPQGLSLNTNTGVLSGTPSTATAASQLTITVTDGAATVHLQGAISVYQNSNLTGTPPQGTAGEAYSFTPVVTGGGGTQVFSISSGSLPTGLTLNTSTGAITGVPLNNGVSSIVLEMTDLGGASTATFVILVGPALAISGTAPVGVSGQLYTFAPVVGGGNGSRVFTLSAALPVGLSLNTSTGVISGVPTFLGTTALTLTVTDGVETQSIAFSIVIQQPVSISGVYPVGVQGSSYTFTPAVVSGGGAQVFSIQSGSLPTGVFLDTATGTLAGVPTITGSFIITLHVTDAYTSANLPGTILIASPGTNISTINPSSPTDFASDTMIAAYDTQYRAVMGVANPSPSAQATGMILIGKITLGVVQSPTDTALGLLWQMHADFQNSLFTEINFFRGFAVLDGQTQNMVSAVYTAYRSVINYQTSSLPNFNQLLTVTKCQRMVTYLKTKLAQIQTPSS